MKHVLDLKWVLLLVFLVGCSSTGTKEPDAELQPGSSGTVRIDETQVMLLVGGSSGKGILNVDGKTHSFTISGMKLGGLGVHKLHFTGNVYNLKKLQDFTGTYFSAEAALTLAKGKGGFWMKNGNGVSIHLSGSADGLALGLGVEGAKITLED